MSSTTADPDAPDAPDSQAPKRPVQQVGDRVFVNLARGAGILILLVLAGVAVFLVAEAAPAFVAPASELPEGRSLAAYIAPLVFGTVLSAAIALVVATPLAVAVALFISHFAPPRVAQTLGYLVDLLAAVPSLIYGLWGASVLGPASVPLSTWLYDWFGWLPFFAGPVSATGRTMLVAGLVLAVMILPIITAVTREVFVQTPRGQIEAALALGATRWEVVKTTVLPFGLSGYISGAMLGLGRALGETIALLIILRGTQQAFGWSLFDAGYTFASKIAAAASEFNDQYKAGAYIAAGLVLFILTFIVNSLARAAVAGRSKS